MMEQSSEPLLLVFPCSLPHTTQSLGHPFPALCQACVGFHDVLLGHGPSLHHLRRQDFPGLVRRLRRYYAPVRLLAGVPARIALLASRTGPGTGRPPDADEVSRFSRVQFLDVRTALGLRRAWRQLAFTLPPVWPSRCMHSVGARYSFFEARFLARQCLCLHFTRHLTAPSARLEVEMVRYSFLVGLFHPRLHAGLSRRLRMLTNGGSALVSRPGLRGRF